MRRMILATMLAELCVPSAARAFGIEGPEPTGLIGYGPVAASEAVPQAALEETLTVFPAPAPCSGHATVVIDLVGGWWVLEHRGLRDKPIMQATQRDEGCRMVIEGNYVRGIPSNPLLGFWYGEHQDVEAIVEWAHEHAAEYGGDPNNIGLVGSSAGAQLALIAANDLAVSQPGLVKFVAELSGPGLNFGPSSVLDEAGQRECNDTSKYRNPNPALDPSPGPNQLKPGRCEGFLQELLNAESDSSGDGPSSRYVSGSVRECLTARAYVDCSAANEIERSPINSIPSGDACVPLWVSWGEGHEDGLNNDLVDKYQSIEYAIQARKDGCEVTEHPAKGGHGFEFFSQIRAPLLAWIDEH